MPTLTTLVRAFLSLGNESARAEVDRTIAGLTLKHEKLVNVLENNGGVVTLWDGTTGADLAAWSYGIVIVDPTDDSTITPKSAGFEALVTLQYQTLATFVIHSVTREVPLVIANRKSGTGATEAAAFANLGATNVQKILVCNANAVGVPANSNDVKVRCLLFG